MPKHLFYGPGIHPPCRYCEVRYSLAIAEQDCPQRRDPAWAPMEGHEVLYTTPGGRKFFALVERVHPAREGFGPTAEISYYGYGVKNAETVWVSDLTRSPRDRADHPEH